MKYPIQILEPLPIPLRNIWSPPERIYFQGTDAALQLLERLPRDGLAVVGTRNPQPRSILFLKNQFKMLNTSRLVIVSGFARGIDAVAHTASIEAGLPTVAILGTALDCDYPKENRFLREQILRSNGLILSEFTSDSRIYRSYFLQRNRLIAGWSQATWVVEAGFQSGALNTAKWAREQNRTCFATPCFPGDISLAGNQVLIDRDHALPFWGPHSLGAVWLDLPLSQSVRKPGSQFYLPSYSPLISPLISKDEQLLIHEIQLRTERQGGVSISDLFNWAAQKGWKSKKLFELIGTAGQKKAISEMNGIIMVCSQRKP